MNTNRMIHPWRSEMYKDKLGVKILSLLDPQPDERILDIGCGNGDLTAEIARSGAIPTGIDFSEEMVERAGQKYPELKFQVADATSYRPETTYDAVFSHAAVHWIKDAPAVVKTIWRALREGGRFVAEFAGSGNLASLTAAMKTTLEARGYVWEGRSPWYFPTIAEYTSLLEQNGFRVTFAQHFDNLRPLHEGIGIDFWLDRNAGMFFHDVPSGDKAAMYREIESRVKPHLEQDGQWRIDISRMRIVAVKESS